MATGSSPHGGAWLGGHGFMGGTSGSSERPRVPIATAMKTLAFLTVVLLGPPMAVGVRARRHGRRLLAVAALAAIEAAGTFVCGFGLLVLAFNGHIEDNGSPPAHTLWLAIPVLLLGAVMLLGGWLASGRR
jgi:hypothetical protein